MIWKRPFLSVCAVLEMLPWYDVAVMRAPEIGSVSGGGPVTRPRMMSVDCWAAAGTGLPSRAPPRQTSRARREDFTTTIYGITSRKVAGRDPTLPCPPGSIPMDPPETASGVDESQLIDQVLTGDMTAARRLYDAHLGAVHR